jgi:hypothetical protein
MSISVPVKITWRWNGMLWVASVLSKKPGSGLSYGPVNWYPPEHGESSVASAWIVAFKSNFGVYLALWQTKRFLTARG